MFLVSFSLLFSVQVECDVAVVFLEVHKILFEEIELKIPYCNHGCCT